MHRVDAPGNDSNMYTDGNPAAGQQATQVRAAWLNDVQENICGVIEAAGIVLEKDDYTQLLEAITALKTSGSLIATRVFTANTAYEATEGTNAIEVIVVGGGGGGGGSAAMSASQFAGGGGGGSGGWGVSRLIADFDGEAITVGASGAGGIGAANGSAGGTSSFGALISATGGAGGSFGAAATVGNTQVGGQGGTCEGANLYSSTGESGLPSIAFSSANMVSGAGGSSMLGAGGRSLASATADGVAGGGKGGGGGGAVGQNSAAARTGGAGAPGVVIIREYA